MLDDGTAAGGTAGKTVAGGVTRLNGVNLPVILCGAGSGAEPSVSLFQAAAGRTMTTPVSD